MKTRGRKHSPGEKQLLMQVASEFKKKRDDLGAKRVAEELNICLASVYKYAKGEDLPRMEVLRDAQRKWGIKWRLIDPSEILKNREAKSGEKQLVFAFLDALRKENVEVTKIGPESDSVLQVVLQIRFSA